MRPKLWSLLLATLLLAAPGHGATPYRVKDINPMASPESSEPRAYLRVGGVGVFTAQDYQAGREIWRSDGTAAGTYRLADICPGDCPSELSFLTATERALFFLASFSPSLTGERQSELWVTGGDISNTFRLAEGVSAVPGAWLASRGVLLYGSGGRNQAVQLWRSDGTPAGTYAIPTASPVQGAGDFVAAGDQVFFTAAESNKRTLWRSDGTSQGTRKLKDPALLSTLANGWSLPTAAGNRIFFVGSDPAHGSELWSSDGTEKGTKMAADLTPGPASSQFWNLAFVNGHLYFVADAGGKGEELWTSDGRPRGTRSLTNFADAHAFSRLTPPDGTFYSFPLEAAGKRLLFVADDGQHGFEPWTADGTTAGTALLGDLCPGTCSGWSYQSQVQPQGQRLYFTGRDATHGFEPWTTDGTPAGTRMVRDVCRGICSSVPQFWGMMGDRLFFLGSNPQSYFEVWSTNGTAAGTVRITDFTAARVRATISPRTAALASGFLFTASERSHGRELWLTDGTREGTHLVADIDPTDFGGSFPHNLRAVGDRVLFFADDGVHGYGLWKSDGTEPGTVPVQDASRPRLERPMGFESAHRLGNLLLFSVYEDGEYSLWRTDGTDAGTLRLTTGGMVLATAPAAVGATAFFIARDRSEDAGGFSLWRTDGTPAGTQRIQDVGSPAGRLVAFKGRIFFVTGTETAGYELWSSDGSAAGTLRVQSFPSRYAPQEFLEHAGRLYFFASDDEHGVELWRTDGTSGGTSRVTDLAPGQGSFELAAMASLPSGLLISGRASSSLSGFWMSDGTAAGTRHISTQWTYTPYALSSESWYALPVVNGRAFFSAPAAAGSDRGALWTTDGTEAGTRLLHDREGQPLVGQLSLASDENRLFIGIAGGVWQSDGTDANTFQLASLETSRAIGDSPSQLTLVGSRLFFQYFDLLHGRELWAIQLP